MIIVPLVFRDLFLVNLLFFPQEICLFSLVSCQFSSSLKNNAEKYTFSNLGTVLYYNLSSREALSLFYNILSTVCSTCSRAASFPVSKQLSC